MRNQAVREHKTSLIATLSLETTSVLLYLASMEESYQIFYATTVKRWVTMLASAQRKIEDNKVQVQLWRNAELFYYRKMNILSL